MRENYYVGVSQRRDGTWEFTVEKAGSKIKTVGRFSTTKVAALLRDEYILQHHLEDQQRNFTLRRRLGNKPGNEVCNQRFGQWKQSK